MQHRKGPNPPNTDIKRNGLQTWGLWVRQYEYMKHHWRVSRSKKDIVIPTDRPETEQKPSQWGGGGLTFSKIMSISEYFIPLTRIGISLKGGRFGTYEYKHHFNSHTTQPLHRCRLTAVPSRVSKERIPHEFQRSFLAVCTVSFYSTQLRKSNESSAQSGASRTNRGSLPSLVPLKVSWCWLIIHQNRSFLSRRFVNERRRQNFREFSAMPRDLICINIHAQSWNLWL